MTPAYDWTRFDALREELREEGERYRGSGPPLEAWRSRLRGKVADAREALERGQPVRMAVQQSRHRACEALTPDQFVDLWEQGYRP